MYDVTFQTEARYKSVKYGQGTIYSSACGPASLCNALKVLGIASVSLPTMCKLAVSCGARVTGGTDMHQLLRAASKKYAFAYRTTSRNAELLAHLKSGGTAILHAGTEYKLFSTSGHFVCAAAAKGSTITVKVSNRWNQLLMMMNVGIRPPPKNMGNTKNSVNHLRPTRSRRDSA